MKSGEQCINDVCVCVHSSYRELGFLVKINTHFALRSSQPQQCNMFRNKEGQTWMLCYLSAQPWSVLVFTYVMITTTQ